LTRRIIGIAGRKRSGKNTFAEMLQVKHQYQQIAFSDALWNVLLAADPWIDPKGWRLSQIMHDTTRDEAKMMFPEIRRLLQRLGSEGVRDNIGVDTWLNVVTDKIIANPTTSFLVTDVRFENEAQRIRELGGKIIKIERPGVEESYGSNHASEQFVAAIQEDMLVNNESDLMWLAGLSLDVEDLFKQPMI
jgi:hypothetical protein